MKPGTVVAGRYRCERLLGRGGMGEVHAAIDLRTDRWVALKLMLGHRLDNPAARARFEREARVGARIDSDYLVYVYDAGADGETPFLVMELLDGEDLEQRLARLGPRPAAEVVDHLAQVALALTRMRSERVVHRDLKPSNIFLQTRSGEPPRIKVLDLGLAKELTESVGQTTSVAGTPAYMAPEQISSGRISAATDRYALGLIAFTLLAGATYWSKAPDEEPIALAIRMKDGPRSPATARARALGIELPAAFDAWFARATARRPDRRFPTAIAAIRELATALGVDAPPLPDEPDVAPAPDELDETTDDASAAGGVEPSGATETAPPRTGAFALARTIPSDAQPAPRPAPRARRRGVAAAVAVVALGAASIAWVAWPRSTRAPSPLADPDTVLACPVLAVEGDVAEWGWLGAAAASLACERARVILGGLPSRTLLPAELLDLPAGPADNFPIDPYGAATARMRTIEAARSRGDAYLDGTVTRTAGSFDVGLALRLPDGRALRQVSASRRGLYDAVRAAMQQLEEPRLIPSAAAPDPIVADYGGGRDVASLMRYLDLTLAFWTDAGQAAAECASFAAADERSPDREQFSRYHCAMTFGTQAPPVRPTAPITTPGAEAARARIGHMALRSDPPETIARIEQLYREAPSPWARSVLATTIACLVQQTNPEEGRQWALRALQNTPKNPTGEVCAPWGQLLALDSRPAVWRAMQAWQPWHPQAWADGAVDDQRLAYAERAYLLAPFNTSFTGRYTEALLAAGRREDVRAVAILTADGGQPVHAVRSKLLLVQVAVSETRFAQAITLAGAAMVPHPDDAGWAWALRLELAVRALQVAIILERSGEVADAAVDALVLDSATHLDALHGAQHEWVPTLCTYASPARSERCFARLAELLPALSATPSPSTDAFIAGARRYAAGDLRGAAAAWQPLVRGDSFGALAEAMVVAFAAAGDHNVVARILEHGGDRFNGASMVMVRAAQAARDRGDRAEAARLAKLVLDAWSDAEVKPPALTEMRTLSR